MRWFVEISSVGTGSEPPVKLCVDAPQWQPALQKARAMRGDEGSLGNFSIELLDDGYRAIDPVKRLRYVVKKAPNDAPITDVAAAKPAPALPSSVPTPAAAEPPRRPMMQTAAYGSTGAAVVRAEAEALAQAKAAAAPPRPASISTSSAAAVAVPAAPPAPKPPIATPNVARAPSVPPAASSPAPSYRVLASREENPTPSSPLTYREFVYAVPEGTTADAAEKLLRERFDAVKQGLEGVQGKLVNMAIFDHVFQGRPERRPLVTLSWKDWRGDPEVTVVGRTDKPSAAPAAPAAAAAPAAPKLPAIPPAPAVPKMPVTSKPTPAPVAAVKAPSNPPRTASQPPKKSGEELLAELTAAATDLHFLSDPLEGADFILALANEKLPSELVVVYFLDADKRELVVVRQRGGKHDKLLTRTSEKTGLAQAAIRGGRAIVITDAQRDPRAVEARWKAMGVDPKSLVCAPATHGGKTYGLIEIVNPEGGGRYAAVEGNALTYLGHQLGEFLATAGVVLDQERITKTAKKAN